MQQALADKGRFLPDFDCNADGRSTCNLHKEAKHCVQGPVHPFMGAGQECCYNREGDLLLTHDKKWGGSPNRAHPWGVVPYRESRKVSYANCTFPYKASDVFKLIYTRMNLSPVISSNC